MRRLTCGTCHRFRAVRGSFPPRCMDCRRLEIRDAALQRIRRERR